MNVIRWVSKNRIEVLILLSLYFLALGVRLGPADRFPNIMGFDSYWAARHTKHIIEGGWFPYNETMIDYPFGRTATATELGWWGVNAVSYKAAAAVLGVNGFDYNLFGKIASWNTALFGALAIPALYLFLRKSFNRIAGLAGALFLTGMTSHLQYSIYGHAENDGLGFSLLFLALYTFVLAVKEGKKRYLVLNALVFSWLAMTWQSYIVAVGGISVTMAAWFTFIAAMKMAGYVKEPVERGNYILGMASILPAIFADLLFSSGHYAPIVLLPLAGSILYCAVLQLFYFKPHDMEYLKSNYRDPVVLSGLAALVLMGVLAPVYSTSLYKAPLGFAGISIGGGQGTPDYTHRLDTTIAEQMRIGGGFFNRITSLSKSYFGVFIWLAFLGGVWALAKSVIMPFVNKRFDHELDALVAVLVLVVLFTQTSKAQTTFFLSSVVALGSGYLISELWKSGKRFLEYAKIKRGRELAGVTAVAVILVLAMPNVLLTEETSKGYGYDVPPSWWQTFEFINNSIPNGSVFAFWWDYGHWIAYFNGDKVSMLTDNVHSTPGSIYVTAASFTHTPACRVTANQVVCDASEKALEKAEQESLSILKPFGTTHILIDKEMVVGKFGAPQRIANNMIGYGIDIPCDTVNNQTMLVCFVPVTRKGEPTSFYPLTFSYDKEKGLLFDQATGRILQFNATWPGDTNTYTFPRILDAGNASMRVFFENDSSEGEYYRNLNSIIGYGVGESGWLSLMDWYNKQLQKRGGPELKPDVDGQAYTMFAVSPQMPAFYSFLYRLYFKDPGLKHVKLVYDNGWNKIYRIDWEGVPDPDKFPRENPNLPAWTEQFYEVFKKGGK